MAKAVVLTAETKSRLISLLSNNGATFKYKGCGSNFIKGEIHVVSYVKNGVSVPCDIKENIKVGISSKGKIVKL
tara:strand:+ start:91 stop:312 length:222 start_codon:yes stop_codon:yes gene_type:complete